MIDSYASDPAAAIRWERAVDTNHGNMTLSKQFVRGPVEVSQILLSVRFRVRSGPVGAGDHDPHGASSREAVQRCASAARTRNYE